MRLLSSQPHRAAASQEFLHRFVESMLLRAPAVCAAWQDGGHARTLLLVGCFAMMWAWLMRERILTSHDILPFVHFP